jgi:hypothetical protein
VTIPLPQQRRRQRRDYEEGTTRRTTSPRISSFPTQWKLSILDPVFRFSVFRPFGLSGTKLDKSGSGFRRVVCNGCCRSRSGELVFSFSKTSSEADNCRLKLWTILSCLIIIIRSNYGRWIDYQLLCILCLMIILILVFVSLSLWWTWFNW